MTTLTPSDWRTNESLLRRVLPESMPLIGKIIEVGAFTPGGVGMYGGFIVACEREDAPFPSLRWSTNHAVYNSERAEWYATNGHYEMSLDDALDDLRRRPC